MPRTMAASVNAWHRLCMFLAPPQIDSFINVSKLFMRMIMSLSTFIASPTLYVCDHKTAHPSAVSGPEIRCRRHQSLSRFFHCGIFISGTVLVALFLALFLSGGTVLFDMARRHRPTAGFFGRKRGFLPYPHPAIVLSCAGRVPWRLLEVALIKKTRLQCSAKLLDAVVLG